MEPRVLSLSHKLDLPRGAGQGELPEARASQMQLRGSVATLSCLETSLTLQGGKRYQDWV